MTSPQSEPASAPASGERALDLVPGDDPRVRAERERVLYSQAVTTFAGNLVFALILALLFLGHVPGGALALWLAVISAFLAARLALARVFNRCARTPGPWGRRYALVSLGVAACWGTASLWLMPVSDRVSAAGASGLDLKLLLVVLVFGISAGAVAALYPSLRLAWGFMLVVMAPALACFASSGTESDAALFAMGLGYVLAMLRIAGTSHATLLSSLRLRFATDDMAARLEQANRDGDAMNRELARMRDAALDALRHKSEFLATMSHEIRTPLNGMLGMLELIEEGDLKARERRFAGTARMSGEALLGLINDVLDFSRIEAGKLELEPHPFDLRELVEEVGALFAERAQRKGLEIAASLPCAGPCPRRGDAARLRQVLANLVGNAVKFTEHGTVEVRVTLPGSGDVDEAILFEVNDSGIGISREAQARIFQSFAQADPSTTRRFGGSGLGLAICAELVRLMGGELRVDSTPGRGSRFWFRIPLPGTADVGDAPRGATPGPECGPVLIAAPCEVTRSHLREQLACWGVDAHAEPDVTRAAARIEAATAAGRGFTLAFVDRGPASGDGMAAVRAVLAASGAPPVVLLCPVHALVPEDEIAQLGVRAQLGKPVRAEELRHCLTRPVPTAASQAAGSPGPAPAPRLAGRVLLAEDGPVNVELAVAMLTALGLGVDVVENGREAVDAVSARDYDLVLMDWQMPEMDGIDAARAIRALERSGGSGRRVPIVAVTANAMAGDEAKCLDAGMDGYMTKPYRKKDLAATCARWLDAPRGHEADRAPGGASARRAPGARAGTVQAASDPAPCPSAVSGRGRRLTGRGALPLQTNPS